MNSSEAEKSYYELKVSFSIKINKLHTQIFCISFDFFLVEVIKGVF